MRKSLQMAPVSTPTNGESDQLQAFEKVPTPVSEEVLPTEQPPLTEDVAVVDEEPPLTKDV